jgi:hypothetical protein
MITVGCKDSGEATPCANPHCRSNATNPPLTPNEAAVRTIEMATRAPVPLCVTLRAEASNAAQRDVFEHEERPEVDEDEDDQAAITPPELACSPRRRLFDAKEMDQTLNLTVPDREATRSEAPGGNGTLDGRRVSLSKQKLMDALQKSFPVMRPELQAAKKHGG